ncbi:MAG: glycosyltransferase family 2 protein [Rubricella sp.]
MASVSVIVCNWKRREALGPCLRGLRGQTVSGFEIIVVSDRPHPETGIEKCARWIPFDEANVAAARNAGMERARGEILAFIDDDSVAEPGWLNAILGGIGRRAAATGPVIGPDGLNRQWGLAFVGPDGEDRPAPSGETIAPKLNGTNMAIRRDALQAVGGFDEGFAYYLDDADMALRLYRQGLDVAWVEDAKVIHGYARSPLRTARRVPRSLLPFGRSRALFLQRTGHDDPSTANARFRAYWNSRLRDLHRLGLISRKDWDSRLAELEQGLSDPAQSRIPAIAEAAGDDLEPVRAAPRPGAVVLSRPFSRRKATRDARILAARGYLVTLVSLHHGLARQSVLLDEDGLWHHRGGTRAGNAAHRAWTLTEANQVALAAAAARARPDLVLHYSRSGARMVEKYRDGLQLFAPLHVREQAIPTE